MSGIWNMLENALEGSPPAVYNVYNGGAQHKKEVLT